MAKKRPTIPANALDAQNPLALARYTEGVLQTNTDGGLADNTVRDGNFMIDPDPFADTTNRPMSPTSTTNPVKPRTLAAGYNAKTQVLTVVFRDGTWWNYYDVPLDIWDGFRQAESKGKFLQSSGLDHWGSMGPANLSGMTQGQRATLNAVAINASRTQKSSGGQQVNSMSSQFE